MGILGHSAHSLSANHWDASQSRVVTAAGATSFALPAASLRVFQRAVGCLVKIGRDAALILRPDELVLHGADDAHSSAVQFAFRKRFFHATPGSQALACARAVQEETRIVVGARALLVALRGAQQRTVECLTIGLSSAGDGELRLVLEFAARFGGRVRHRVPLLDNEAFLPGEPVAGPYIAALSASLLARVLDHCAPPSRGSGSGCEEVTLAAAPQDGLRVRSVDLLSGNGASGGSGSTNRTEVLLQKSDLEVCRLDGVGGEATFPGRGLRDFAKTTDACMKDLEGLHLLDGSPVLELRFGQGGSVVCRLAAARDGEVRSLQEFTAVFIVATRELLEAEGLAQAGAPAAPMPADMPGSGVPPTQPSTVGRRAQPKQGPKRRALSAAPSAEAFDAFPDHRLTSSQQHQPVLQPRLQEPIPSRSSPPMPIWAASIPFVAHNVTPMTAMVPTGLIPQVPAATPTPLAATVPVSPGSPLVRTPHVSVAGSNGDFARGVDVAGSRDPFLWTASVPPLTPSNLPTAAQFPPQLRPNIPPQPQWQPPQQLPLASSRGVQQVLASQLMKSALDATDSDDELIGADPDEVAYGGARLAPLGEENADWFDVDRLW